MKAVVHMGMPKTGTSTIQHWLHKNAASFPARGVAFERAKMPNTRGRRSHVELVLCQHAEAGVLTKRRLGPGVNTVTDMASLRTFADRYAEVFAAAIAKAKADTLIFSSEGIGHFSTTPELAKGLDTWLLRHFDEVRYIVYYRRQEDWVLSRYSQALRGGYKHALARFVRENHFCDYSVRANAWEEAVGRERLDVRLFERDTMVGGDLLVDFADAVGFDPEGLEPVKLVNPSFTIGAAEFLRQANLEPAPMGPQRKMPNGYMDQLAKRLTYACSDGRKLSLNQDQIDYVRAENAEGNERLRQACFADRAELFPARQKVDGGAQANIATGDEMANVGIRMLQESLAGRLSHVTADESEPRGADNPHGSMARGRAKGTSA